MIEIKLSDILKNQRFGPVNLGDSKEMVIDYLGKPNNGSGPDALLKPYEIICYDAFEFTFYKGQLEMFKNKYILNKDYNFNKNFYFKNNKFRILNWFSDYKKDLKINSFKEKLSELSIDYREEPFWDTIRFLIGPHVELQFHSQLAYQKNPEEWNQYTDDDLNWKLAAFYAMKKTNPDI